jgi:hypothetical protein
MFFGNSAADKAKEELEAKRKQLGNLKIKMDQDIKKSNEILYRQGELLEDAKKDNLWLTKIQRETEITDFAKGNLPLSTLSSLAGIFSAYSTYENYSGILTENPTLTATIVMISFQSFIAVTNILNSLFMIYHKLEYYK